MTSYLCICRMLSCVQLLATFWTVAREAPLSTGFSRQEQWSGLPCPPPGDLLTQGSNPSLPCLLRWQAGSLPLDPRGGPTQVYVYAYNIKWCDVQATCDAKTRRSWSRTEKEPHVLSGQLVFDKRYEKIQWRKESFEQMALEQLCSYMPKTSKKGKKPHNPTAHFMFGNLVETNHGTDVKLNL